MKKLYVAVIILALSVPALSWSSPYTTSFKDGKYDGSMVSVVPEINGMKAKMEVKHEGENAVFTVTYGDGAKEVWVLNDKTLQQKELDKAGKVTKEYGATAAKSPTGTEQSYKVNCKDPAKNDCDAGVDSRGYWTLKANGDEIKYLYFGVPKDKKGDSSVKAEKRIELTCKVTK